MAVDYVLEDLMGKLGKKLEINNIEIHKIAIIYKHTNITPIHTYSHK